VRGASVVRAERGDSRTAAGQQTAGSVDIATILRGSSGNVSYATRIVP
jgi:hypothetical protein